MSPFTLKTSGYVSALLLLAGCSGGVYPGGDAEVNIDNDGSMQIETDEGTFEAGSNATIPENWPSDAPAYPGAQVMYSASTNPTAGQSDLALVLMTADSLQQVKDFYANALKENGWTVTATMDVGGTTVIGASKAGRALSLSFATSEQKTSITIGLRGGE